MTEPARPAAALTLRFTGGAERAERAVAVEVPVRVSYAGVPFGVMMMTPADFEDFAYGFSLTEGMIAGAAEVRGVAVEAIAGGFGLDIVVAGSRLASHLARQRALTGRTSCGVCGVTDIAALRRADPVATAPPTVALGAIGAALAALDAHQPLNAATRAVHGAAWATTAGDLGPVREDVGRHNALDKLVGALLRADTDPGTGFVLVTSRASFEMVEKVASFGARMLVAISAPTTLALERARALDVTLVGIARRDAVTVFHGADRIGRP